MNIRRTIVLTFLLATTSVVRNTALAEDVERREERKGVRKSFCFFDKSK